MEKSFRRMKVLINLVVFYLSWFQGYELVGPWRHDPNMKEKARASKPAASTSNASSSSSSSSSSTSSSSASQNNNVEDEIVALDGEVSVDSDYTSNPVEANKVRVDRARRQKWGGECMGYAIRRRVQKFRILMRGNCIRQTECGVSMRQALHAPGLWPCRTTRQLGHGICDTYVGHVQAAWPTEVRSSGRWTALENFHGAVEARGGDYNRS